MRHRPATEADVARMHEIEHASGQAFADVGMPEIADDPEPTAEVIAGYVAAGRAFVTVDDDDRPVAYAVVDRLDGNVHIEQVSVDPAAARRGIGARLIDHIGDWAAARGAPALTLTTFRDVPWNAPYYARLGFRVLAEDDIGPALTAVRTHESRLGPWPRVAMRRDLRATPR